MRRAALVGGVLLGAWGLAACGGASSGVGASSATPPGGLTYSVNPAFYSVGFAITPNTPSSIGGAVASYSVSPSLPAGFSLDTTTGVISGTPSTVSVRATYTVTAVNPAGATTTGLDIKVDAYAGRFEATGSMSVPRYAFCAVRLTSGVVLVSGSATGDTSSAELYDPRTRAFTPTGPMTVPRGRQTCTLLPSGQVLMIGGASSLSILAGSEIYDPTAGRFTAIAGGEGIDLTASVMLDGRVLAAGGLGTSAQVLGAVVFASGSFSGTGAMATNRYGHAATVLADGRVLVAGGFPGGLSNPQLASAEIYDPATGSFAPTSSMMAARYGFTMTRLLNGKVLVAGGFRDPSTLPSAEIYDPASGRFTSTGSMARPRTHHTATLLPDGRVLVVGGNIDVFSPTATAEIYDPATGTFSDAGSMAVARLEHVAALLPDGTVLVAGGYSEVNSNPASAEIWRPRP
jgi:hypothetical protein